MISFKRMLVASLLLASATLGMNGMISVEAARINAINCEQAMNKALLNVQTCAQAVNRYNDEKNQLIQAFEELEAKVEDLFAQPAPALAAGLVPVLKIPRRPIEQALRIPLLTADNLSSAVNEFIRKLEFTLEEVTNFITNCRSIRIKIADKPLDQANVNFARANDEYNIAQHKHWEANVVLEQAERGEVQQPRARHQQDQVFNNQPAKKTMINAIATYIKEHSAWLTRKACYGMAAVIVNFIAGDTDRMIYGFRGDLTFLGMNTVEFLCKKLFHLPAPAKK